MEYKQNQRDTSFVSSTETQGITTLLVYVDYIYLIGNDDNKRSMLKIMYSQKVWD